MNFLKIAQLNQLLDEIEEELNMDLEIQAELDMELIALAKSLKKSKGGLAKKSNPSLWSRCKSEAKAKMGGKHSARAMQLAVKLYKQRGGKYKGKKPTAKTNKMKKWTKQKWMYLSDYKKKKKDKNKADDHFVDDEILDSNDAKGRYLPEAKWKSLTPTEREATDRKKKREGKHKQYVSNTEKAKVKSKSKYYSKK